MDARRFDALTRALSTGSRRGLLATLLTLPGLSALLTFLGADDTAAKGRRKRRKKRHKHGKGNGRHRKGKRNKKRCKPKSRARICAGTCGIVKNRKTCKKKVNCGSCACDPPCAVCQICDGISGACGPDAEQDGQPCGEPGEECQAGVCVQTCTLPDADLQTAINNTQAGGTLVLCAGTWLLDATVTITNNLTLRGAGAVLTSLDGKNAVRVLQIEAGAEVTLQDLTVTRGKENRGGGILNGGTLKLRGVAVTVNTTMGSGGGIVNDGSLTLQNGSQVAGNSSVLFGGGIDNSGELILKAGSVVGGDSLADANTANHSGGGIYNFDSGTLTLEAHSRVTGNTTTNSGGGIANGGTVILEDDSRVTGNAADDEAGGIYNFSTGTVTVQDDALVCDNNQSVGDQCAGQGTLFGECPNPESGFCPA